MGSRHFIDWLPSPVSSAPLLVCGAWVCSLAGCPVVPSKTAEKYKNPVGLYFTGFLAFWTGSLAGRPAVPSIAKYKNPAGLYFAGCLACLGRSLLSALPCPLFACLLLVVCLASVWPWSCSPFSASLAGGGWWLRACAFGFWPVCPYGNYHVCMPNQLTIMGLKSMIVGLPLDCTP